MDLDNLICVSRDTHNAIRVQTPAGTRPFNLNYQGTQVWWEDECRSDTDLMEGRHSIR